MEIRDAVLIDAVAACDVLKRSITELCVADHRNDPALLKRWLAEQDSRNRRSVDRTEDRFFPRCD